MTRLFTEIERPPSQEMITLPSGEVLIESESGMAHAVVHRLKESFPGASEKDIFLVIAQLRGCPVGAHIDHQKFKVTGFSLNRHVFLAFVPSGSTEVRARSLNPQFGDETNFQLDQIPDPVNGHWGNYLRGAAQQCKSCLDLT